MKTFRIAFQEWTAWSITLDATSEEDAIQKANELWDEVGPDAGFKIRDCSTDEWEATS